MSGEPGQQYYVAQYGSVEIHQNVIGQYWHPENDSGWRSRHWWAHQFLNVLSRCTAEAVRLVERRVKNPKAEIFQCDAGNKQVQRFLRNLKALRTTNTKRNVMGANYGNLVQEEAYYLLPKYWDKPRKIQEDEVGDYVLETPEKLNDHAFSASFEKTAAGTKKMRPDVRLALGEGYEAVYDITSMGGLDHITKRNRLMQNRKVLFIAEVAYPSKTVDDFQ